MKYLLGALMLMCSGALYRAEAVEAELAQDIRQRLQTGVQKLSNEQMDSLYRLSGYEPLWYGTPQSTAIRTALLTEIRRRPLYGLAPDPECDRDRPEQAAPEARAEADVALSQCLLRLRTAVSEGSVPPTAMGDWHLSGDAQPITTADVADIRKGDVQVLLQRVAPQAKDYRALQEALAAYLNIAAMGGWNAIPGASEILLDGTDARVEALKQRLAAEDYIPADGDISLKTVESVVRRFQADKGLVVDGRVGRQTLAALNVTVEARITQLAVNMERWRQVPRSFGDSYVAVNAADATLVVLENGQPVIQMRTIIGDVKHQTPTFHAEITGVTVNPAWTIPASIAAKEILPKLKRNPKYLAENEIVILNREDDPSGLTVRWETISARRFPFQLRQRPGSKNPLGLMKFEMSNPFDVYLHDTNARSLFALPRRGLSHGCVRVEEPETLALRLLPEQTAEEIRSVISAGATKTLPLAHPRPVYILYWTAFASEDGRMQFRDDHYGRDPAIARELQLHRSAPSLGTNPLVSKDNCPPVA